MTRAQLLAEQTRQLPRLAALLRRAGGWIDPPSGAGIAAATAAEKATTWDAPAAPRGRRGTARTRKDSPHASVAAADAPRAGFASPTPALAAQAPTGEAAASASSRPGAAHATPPQPAPQPAAHPPMLRLRLPPRPVAVPPAAATATLRMALPAAPTPVRAVPPSTATTSPYRTSQAATSVPTTTPAPSQHHATRPPRRAQAPTPAALNARAATTAARATPSPAPAWDEPAPFAWPELGPTPARAEPFAEAALEDRIAAVLERALAETGLDPA